MTAVSARAEAVTRRTYNRPLDDNGTQFETWTDTVQRAQYAHHERLWTDAGGTPDLAELQELRALGLERSGLVAGRTLWLGGTDYAYSRAASQFNCSALEIATVYDVVDAFWLLLNGCGVGGLPRAGTLHGYNSPINNIKVIPSTNSKDYRGNKDNVETMPNSENGFRWVIKIGDSAQAWAKSLGKLFISPRGTINELVIDFSGVRGKGGRLKGYGWICNGYEPMAEAMVAIHKILNGAAGNLLDEEEIGDVFNWCGTVLSSRRAAEALLLDATHPRRDEFSSRKHEYWKSNPQRRQSNNSLLFWTRPSVDELADLLYMNLNGGEPGFVNATAAITRCPWFRVFNPCFEIILPSHGFCVAGDTVLMTRNSSSPISQLVDKSVEVWNGSCWSKVTPRITGTNQNLVRVTMSDGSRLDCTPYHRFSIQRGDKHEEVMAKDLVPNDVSELFQIGDCGQTEHIPDEAAYTLGVLVGDGSAEGSRVDRGSKWVDLTLYGVKRFLPVLGEKGEEYTPKGYAQSAVKVKGSSKAVESLCQVDVTEFVHSSRTDGYTLLRVLDWSKSAMLAFLAGIADTDGSETQSGGIRIYQQSREFCEVIQLIARKCGMRSSVNLMSEIGEMTNQGPRTKAMWYVSIVECQTIPCHRLDTSRGHAPGRSKTNMKGVYQKVVYVDKLPGKHTVYCFDEPLQHKAVFGNILTHQCNLVSLSLPHFGRDFRKLERATYMMARANYRQTCVNLEDGMLQNRWNQTNQALRLCGVSYTGITQAGWLTDYQIRRLRNSAITGAYSMADELKMPRPKAVTTIKPEGTRSKIAGRNGIEVAEGMHLPLGRFIFNWINFSVNDPLVLAMEAAGYKTLLNPSDSNNVLVRFPVDYSGCKFGVVDGKEVNNESALTQLRRYRRWNTIWADHNVSATISLSREEVPEVAQWLFRNWDNNYIATAFLQRVDATKTAADYGHPYLPQEVVTEASFREVESGLREVDWSRFHTGWHEIKDASDCPTGVCPVR